MIEPMVLSEGSLLPQDMLQARVDMCELLNSEGVDITKLAQLLIEATKEVDPQILSEILDEADVLINELLSASELWFGHHPYDPACVGVFVEEKEEVMSTRSKIVAALAEAKEPLMPKAIAESIDGVSNQNVSQEIGLANKAAEERNEPHPFVKVGAGRGKGAGWVLAEGDVKATEVHSEPKLTPPMTGKAEAFKELAETPEPVKAKAAPEPWILDEALEFINNTLDDDAIKSGKEIKVALHLLVEAFKALH